MATFTTALRAFDDEALVTLLTLRPDLASPAPSSLTSLAARATARHSLDRATAELDAFRLAVAEAVVALQDAAGEGGPHVADVSHAVGAPAHDALADLAARALVWADGERLLPTPGLAELFGPRPAGLAAADPSDPVDVPALLKQVPPEAGAVLHALAWQPIGRLDAADDGSPAGAAVARLVRDGLLRRVDAQHLVLSRTVALVLREGRTHRDVPPVPPGPAGPVRDAATVTAESSRAAEELVRNVADLLRAWEEDPPPLLRTGALGLRDLRRTAARWDADERSTALVVELAVLAGLLADDGDEPAHLAPTHAARDWLDALLPQRWAVLALAWMRSSRTPWEVGTPGDRGQARSALHPELHRPWVPHVREAVLRTLGEAADGTAPDAGDVLAALAWHRPRSAPPRPVVQALLEEAEQVGALGAGALAAAGRALLADEGPAAVASALEQQLPSPVDDLLLQADLTGVVPGRPGAELSDLLDRAAEIESRGGATTVRFTPASVRSALDDGMRGEDLLTELSRFSRTPVPQALEYLVRDEARRHGSLRVGGADSYLRSEDAALLAAALAEPRLRHLGLTRIAPTVVISTADPASLLRSLQDAGLSPVAEDPDGRVVTVRRRPVRRRTSPGSPGAGAGRWAEPRAGGAWDTRPPTGPDPREVVRLLRSTPEAPDVPRSAPPATTARTEGSEAGAHGAAATGSGTPEPGAALVLLREAAAERRTVRIELVGDAGGIGHRTVRPLVVDGGRVRVLDVDRETELTVAVHRIRAVEPDPERRTPRARGAPTS